MPSRRRIHGDSTTMCVCTGAFLTAKICVIMNQDTKKSIELLRGLILLLVAFVVSSQFHIELFEE
jgi:hypothetical protein